MQMIKEFTIDLLKISSVIIGIPLIFMLFGYLVGAESTNDKTMDYFNNIDYAEQIQIDDLGRSQLLAINQIHKLLSLIHF